LTPAHPEHGHTVGVETTLASPETPTTPFVLAPTFTVVASSSPFAHASRKRPRSMASDGVTAESTPVPMLCAAAGAGVGDHLIRVHRFARSSR